MHSINNTSSTSMNTISLECFSEIWKEQFLLVNFSHFLFDEMNNQLEHHRAYILQHGMDPDWVTNF